MRIPLGTRLCLRFAILVCLIIAIAASILIGPAVLVSQPAAASVIDVSHPFLVPSRDHVAICVETVDGSQPGGDTERVRAQVRNALSIIASTPEWEAAGFASAEPTVASGCPQQGYALRSEVSMQGPRERFAGNPSLLRVEQASPFFLFVFVLPDDQISSLFEDWSIRVTSEEMLCNEGTCATATTGVYVSQTELEDQAFMSEWLMKGLGLTSLVPAENVVPDSEKQ